jgi:hypothetical protein
MARTSIYAELTEPHRPDPNAAGPRMSLAQHKLIHWIALHTGCVLTNSVLTHKQTRYNKQGGALSGALQSLADRRYIVMGTIAPESTNPSRIIMLTERGQLYIDTHSLSTPAKRRVEP